MTDETTNGNDLPNIPGLEGIAAQIAAGDGGGDNGTGLHQEDNSQVYPAKTPDGKQVQFKTIEDAFKAYAEVQGFASRLANENKEMKEQLNQALSTLETFQLSLQQAPVANPSVSHNQDFDAAFIQNPEQAIAAKVAATVQQSRIAEVLQDEEIKNKAEFKERYVYAKQVVSMNPGLINSAAGIRKAFELGDQQRQNDLRAQGERFLKMTFGDETDIEALKKQFKKNVTSPSSTGGGGNNINQSFTYMPETGMHTGTRPQTDKTGYQAQINESASKGDIDATVDAVFRNVLAST